MTPLHTVLLDRIAADGPLTVAQYMSECLLHPQHGYYATRDPFGTTGDFITAPEISQMFGELLGLCLAQAWMDQGAPQKCTLAELGPGRGTLMADALRATRGVPGFHQACSVVLVEASETLRNIQAETLKDRDVLWIQEVSALPRAPLFLIANEFFDALPIRQFLRMGDGWAERVIGVREETLTWGRSQPVPVGDLDHRLADTKDGDLVETCAPGTTIAQHVGALIERYGGTALFIDYGDWRSLGDTFQAVSGHGYADPLTTPGEADLTAHVDFEALAQAAPCAHARLTPQGVFLERLGITERARHLAKTAGPTGVETLVSAHRRLTHPSEMGNLFKTLALFPSSAKAPPGVEQ